MLLTIALGILLLWVLGVSGLFAVGQMVHVLLLVGLMLLLLSFAKGRDTAVRRQRHDPGR
jgi:hypothetical protein